MTMRYINRLFTYLLTYRYAKPAKVAKNVHKQLQAYNGVLEELQLN